MKVPTHPVNRDNVRDWLELQRPKDDVEVPIGDPNIKLVGYIIAKTIANNILNVSYDDILCKLNQLVNELFTIYDSSHPNLYLFLPTDRKKSNFVFTIIFYHFCRKKGIEFSGITNARNPKTDNKMIVIVDDATYSGDQIYRHIQTLKAMNDQSEMYFLAISYISDSAINLFDISFRYSFIIIPTSSTRFNCVSNLITPEEYNTIKNTIGGMNILGSINKRLLYFDFKLPDALSIPQTIFAYGYAVLDDNHKTHTSPDDVLSFIGGCEENFKNNLQHEKKTFDLNRQLIASEMCPQSFYKQIRWI